VRKLIYIFSLLCFFPAIFLLLGGMALIPTAVIIDLGKGHLSSLVLLLPLIGGIFGVIMAFTVAFELLAWTNTKVKNFYKYLGLLVGIMSELSISFWITPNLEPFLTFWLPPLLGAGLLLFGLYTNTTNKSLKQDK